jgi:hypothetical protein
VAAAAALLLEMVMALAVLVVAQTAAQIMVLQTLVAAVVVDAMWLAEMAAQALLLFATLIQSPPQLQQLAHQQSPCLEATVFTDGQPPDQLHSNHGRLPIPLKCLWSLEPNGCARCCHGW